MGWRNGSARVAVSVALAVAAMVALFPFSGVDSDPPHHYSVFGYEVPSGSPLLAQLAGLAVGVATWALIGWARGR